MTSRTSTKPKAARSRRRAASWSGSTSAMGRLQLLGLVAAGPEVQVDPAALELELVDLALAVILATGLERQDLQVARQALELGQELSYRHLAQGSDACALREKQRAVRVEGSPLHLARPSGSWAKEGSRPP
jgi:hypothetical protein